jgi:SAM-dependent methyltransferase
MDDRYTQGAYAHLNPSWHSEDSSWKARQIVKMLDRNRSQPKTVCEVGCGAGQILKELHDALATPITYVGYEISPQAHELSKLKASTRLSFKLQDILSDGPVHFDLMLLMDVVEHIEDCFAFLRAIRAKSDLKILHMPLDLSAQAVLRGAPLTRSRDQVGHLHYFTKDLALRFLGEVGYEVIDHFYTCGSLELPSPSVATRLARLPRKIVSRVAPDFAARLLGGFSLLVLAR